MPKLSAGARWGFYKFSQKAGEFAHAIGGVLHDPDARPFRAVIGAIETAPIVVADASALFGGRFGPDIAERLDEQAVLAAPRRKNVKDDYIRSLALVALKRAAKQASRIMKALSLTINGRDREGRGRAAHEPRGFPARASVR